MDYQLETSKSESDAKTSQVSNDPKDSFITRFFKHCCRWNLLILGAVVLLFIVQLSPYIPSCSLVDFNVTDGNVNGTLSLGPYGYCLYLPNKECSHAGFPHKIANQTQVLAQVGLKTSHFSAFNFVAFALAILSYIFSANEGRRIAGALALLAAVSASVGFAFVSDIIVKGVHDHARAGRAFWMILAAILSLAGFIICMVVIIRREKKEAERKRIKERPGNYAFTQAPTYENGQGSFEVLSNFRCQ